MTRHLHGLAGRVAMVPLLALTLVTCTRRVPVAADSATQVQVGDLALDSVLTSLDGRAHQVRELLTRAPWTVFIFYSETCPCVEAHDERVIRLWQEYHARGVSVVMVASESGSSLAGLRTAGSARGYPFPLFLDQGSRLARAWQVRFASQAFVVSSQGQTAYAGAIDSDRRFLHADSEPYLERAIQALLAGRAPAVAPKAAFGCALDLER